MRTVIAAIGLALILPAISQARSLINSEGLNPPIANLNKEINVNGVEPDPFEPVNANAAVPVVDTVTPTNSSNVNDNANVNTNAPPQNSNVNGESGTAPKRGNFRDPAKLVPLLLVPLAGMLFLIYEKIANRRDE